MTLDEVQSAAQAALSRSAKTAQFRSDLIEDGITDHSEEIQRRLEEEGVCLVLGDIEAGQAVNDASPVQALIKLPVFVYDQPNVLHEPSGKMLTDAVVSALTDRHTFLFSAFAKFTNEKGGTLTICEFHATIVFTG